MMPPSRCSVGLPTLTGSIATASRYGRHPHHSPWRTDLWLVRAGDRSFVTVSAAVDFTHLENRADPGFAYDVDRLDWRSTSQESLPDGSVTSRIARATSTGLLSGSESAFRSAARGIRYDFASYPEPGPFATSTVMRSRHGSTHCNHAAMSVRGRSSWVF